MPPQRVKKQPLRDITSSFPAPETNTNTDSEEAARTPKRTPPRRVAKITEAQKQALMDNLQLEITERARKLRSQYGLLAQGLRSRLEMRVNRIPQALRKTNILELVEKYSEEQTARPDAPLPIPSKASASKALIQPAQTKDDGRSESPEFTRGKKRSSNDVFASDKENVQQELSLPKKRTKTTAPKAPINANRVVRQVSRQDAAQVLSPKSNNSRTLPRSPIKNGIDDQLQKSPQKSNLSRPASPMKENRPGTAASGRIARPIPKSSKRTVPTVPAPRKRVSNASSEGAGTDASSGTTVVTKKKASGTTAKKSGATRAAAATAASKKATAAAKKEKENASTATGGRVLRARR
ncbi:hypothetical protein K490DRAFT_64772 [Saccharata proteae CBS 121410]|uniref:Borealin N-terminal domain-containing protein n=1 Tax=Saccharata proteae CBS 121410 TaxID=1314787 RepID=A0A9P4LXE5_9PEZI|nr:hypothetical protein K490DRAFT_64772 [Saccharata proteae CBS 121410]